MKKYLSIAFLILPFLSHAMDKHNDPKDSKGKQGWSFANIFKKKSNKTDRKKDKNEESSSESSVNLKLSNASMASTLSLKVSTGSGYSDLYLDDTTPSSVTTPTPTSAHTPTSFPSPSSLNSPRSPKKVQFNKKSTAMVVEIIEGERELCVSPRPKKRVSRAQQTAALYAVPLTSTNNNNTIIDEDNQPVTYYVDCDDDDDDTNNNASNNNAHADINILVAKMHATRMMNDNQ